jgi:hypothetical protein
VNHRAGKSETWHQNLVQHILPDDRYPTALVIQHLVQNHLAVVDLKYGIEFDMDWDFHGVEGKLQSLLPDLFSQLDLLPEEHNYNLNYPGFCLKAQWMLVTKEHHHASVVSSLPFPSGTNLQQFCASSQHVGFKSCTLLFSTFHLIDMQGSSNILLATRHRLNNDSHSNLNEEHANDSSGMQQSYVLGILT